MDVKCDKCQARYRIDDARVGPAGLTMRCGKCGNTFKVTKGGGTQPVAAPAPSAPPAAPKPAAPPAGDAAGRTMMFAAAPVVPTLPQAKPAAPPAKAPAPPAGDAAGRTMMFAAAPVAKKPAAPPDDAGSTMVFAAAPVVAASVDKSNAAKAAAARAPAAKAVPVGEAAGATLIHGSQPAPAPPRPPQPAPQAAPPPELEPEPQMAAEEAPAAEEAAPEEAPAEPEAVTSPPPPRPAAPIQPMREEQPMEEEGGVVAEGALEPGSITSQQAPLYPMRKKVPVVPIVAIASVIVLAVVGLVVYKRFARQPPTAQVIETMSKARALALKDTPVDYEAAEAQAKAALSINPRVHFPSGYAELAEIEIGWSDALRDIATATGTDNAKDVKARMTAANEALNKGLKQDPQSVDLVLAQANYYRAAGSPSNLGKSVKKAQAVAANDPRLAFVQGMAAGAEDDGHDKAIPLLKSAAQADPTNARVRFRHAQQLAAARQTAAAVKELEEVLKLSPGHKRAKELLDATRPKAAPPADEPKKGK